MTCVPEGGARVTQDLTLSQDGNSTVDHNSPLDIFYKDRVQLWGQTEFDYTPTLVVTDGGPAGDPYWRAHTNVWEHPILTKHIPPTELAANNKRRVIAPESDYVDDDSAREAGKIARSEEHTSELQSLMRISYAVFCLKKNTTTKHNKDKYTNTCTLQIYD